MPVIGVNNTEFGTFVPNFTFFGIVNIDFKMLYGREQSCPGYVKYAAKNPWWVTM
jgi:hypothetical protein